MEKDCLHCHSNHIQKNWVLPRGGQRYACKDCHKHFTIGWKARGTYDQSFKAKIVDLYCHLHTWARDVSKKFNISTSTIVDWAKQHKKECKTCNSTK